MIRDAKARETAEKFYNVKVMRWVDPWHPMRVGDDSSRAVRLRPVGSAAVSVTKRFSANMSDVPAELPLLHSNLDFDLPAEIDSTLKKLGEQPAATQMISELGS